MAPSTQTKPAGTYNNVGVDYLSPKTSSGDIDVLTAAAGTSFFTFDCNNASIEVDTIEEFTAGSGVTVDGVLCKDGFSQGANAAYFSGTLTANSNAVASAFDIFMVDATNHPTADIGEHVTAKNIAYTKANGRFTITPAGVYLVSVDVRYTSTAAATNVPIIVYIKKNGTTVHSQYVSAMTSTNYPYSSNQAVVGPRLFSVSAGQYFNILIDAHSTELAVVAMGSGITIHRIF